MDTFDFIESGGMRADPETERLAHVVIGAAIEVHRFLKPGMPESAYQKALCHELTLRNIPHSVEHRFPITYKGVRVGDGWIDILVGGKLVLELKAVETLSDVHKAQVLGYLQMLNLKLGLLINFNVVALRLGLKRIINTYQ